MTIHHIEVLIVGQLGESAGRRALSAIALDPRVISDRPGVCTRAEFAQALAVCLFSDLLEIVPSGAAYVADRIAELGKVNFDHGAIRTIKFAEGPTGALPAGAEAFRRILEPLGYAMAGVYPLPNLRMTGRAYAHRDFAESIPQYFVSELHVEQFDPEFQRAAERTFGRSVDPLGPAAKEMLGLMASNGEAPLLLTAATLGDVIAAFDRQHDTPNLTDYEVLLAGSEEAAWIATEGNAFNHATDRVTNVEALAARQKELRRPMKPSVEVSQNGRVRQTAFRADAIVRRFRVPGGEIERAVPGSFYEFISRDIDPSTGKLDLTFDSGNATNIFAMTRASA